MLFRLPPALVFFVAMRLLRPWILIRIYPLVSDRIGHFAANTELYLCERDAGINVPNRRYIDLFFMGTQPTNTQLAVMWRRHLKIWPVWLLGPVYKLNKLFPGGDSHEVGNPTCGDRDVHDLWPNTPPHLSFSSTEEARGKANLKAMCIPEDAEFICLIVRDNTYLKKLAQNESYFDYHNYRDSDIQTYVAAAEQLADRGYYVIRMGAAVREAFRTSHPKIIDYAANGMRNDFMDIYLGAKCLFCLSSGTGFDAVPAIFRKPITYVNLLPLGYHSTYVKNSLSITRQHWLVSKKRFLTLKEIFSHGVGFSLTASEFETRGISLIANTPEEIASIAIETLERLKGTWQPKPDDEALQFQFWKIYMHAMRDNYAANIPHGKIRGRFGSNFLRDNQWWLQ